MTDIPNTQPDSRDTTILDAPDKMVRVRDLFGIDTDMEVPAFSVADERVPDLDPAYVFDPDTTLAIIAGMLHEITVRHTAFVFNERRPVSKADYDKLIRSYRKLMTYLRAGDAAGAEQHWRKHLDVSRELLLTGLESVPIRDVMG